MLFGVKRLKSENYAVNFLISTILALTWAEKTSLQ